MEEAKANLDLTTTLHLGVRAVVGSGNTEINSEVLNLLTEEERETLNNRNPHDAMLIVHRGPSRGARFLLNADATIGRSPESDIFLDDVTVSRHHASIAMVSQGSYVLKDCGSLNGTYVNNNSVTEISLKTADEIQIGKFHMLFFGGK